MSWVEVSFEVLGSGIQRHVTVGITYEHFTFEAVTLANGRQLEEMKQVHNFGRGGVEIITGAKVTNPKTALSSSPSEDIVFTNDVHMIRME